MPVPVDEYGIPIRKAAPTNNVEVDEYNIPIKKKIGGNVGGSNGITGFSTQQSGNGHSDSWNKMQAQMAQKAADAGLPNFDNGNDRLNDAINRSEKAGYGFNHFTNNNDPTGDRTVSIDIENLTKALQKRLANEKNPASKTAISKELNYWQGELKDGMTAQEWKNQTGENDPVPQPSNSFADAINRYNEGNKSATSNNLGVDTGMKPVDTKAIKVQEQKTAKQAATNNAHDYFDNNQTLLEQLAKNNENLLEKDEEGKPIKGQYDLKKLEQTPIFNKKVNEILDASKNGNLAITKYQNGKKIGQPVFSKPAGFLESLGNSISNSFKQTKDAIVTKFKSPEEVADYFDKQRKDLPDVPESVPTGYGSMAGNAIGGIIKPAAEFGLGELAQPEGGGLIAAAADIIPTTTSEKTKEIYYDRMNALEAKYGKDKVPENERLDAIHKALSQAPLQALPSEAMQLYLFGKGGNAANTEAIQSFGKVLKNAGADVGKMAALGGGSEIATQGIKQLQSGDGKFDDNISAAAGQWAIMEAAFKALPVTSKALGSVYSKFVNSNAKNVLATADPEVTQKLSEQAVQQGWLSQDQADEVQKHVQNFAKIKETIPANIPENKAALVTGLIQKNESLEADKKTQNPIFHDDINAEIKANEQKAKDILNSSQPLKHETDNLTGERGQNIGGRPTIEETEAKAETLPASENNENGNSEDGRITPDESGTNQENVGETLQPQQKEENGVTVIKPEENIPNDNVAEVNSNENPKTNSVVEDNPAENVPENEMPATSQEQTDIYSEYPPTSLNYSGTGKLETEFGISQREPTTVKHDIETIKEADNLIEKGWKPQDAIDRVESGEANFVSDAEYINLTRYGAELAHRLRDIKDINSAEYDSTLKELNRVANTANAAGQSTGRALGIRSRFKTVPDGSYADFMLTEMAANNDVTLTKNQKITATNEWSKFQKDKEQFGKDKQTFDDAVAKFNAEKEVAKAKKSAPKNTTKTHEDYVKDRVSLIEKLKQQKAEQEKYLADRGIQKAGFGLTLTTDMVKTIKDIVASHVEETAHKLADVIDNVYEQLKEIFPDLEKRDIHNVIAGEYNEKKLTKTEARIRMEDLRIEAQSINKLEKLEKGEVPKNEKAKIKRNAEIEQLRKQIGEHGITKLSAVKQRNEAATERIKEIIKKGDFSPEVKRIPTLQNVEFQKQFPDLFKQVQKSNDELIKTKNDIALRRAKWMYEHKSDNEKTLEVIGKSLNIPRTLMTIGDFSAVFRQAAIATSAHPVIASKALKFMFEASANEKTYNRWLDEVHHDPLWATAEKSKLPITDPQSLHAREHEEAFYGAQYAEKIPGVGAVVKASERAYNGYLNFIRWEMFKMYANEFRAKGKTYENNPKLYEGISSFIGSSTGRGGMSKNLNAASPLLNTVLFASKLIASRLNMLGFSDIPNLAIKGAGYATRAATLGKYGKGWGVDFGFYSKLPKEIRVKAAADMVKFVGVGLATLFLAKSMGAEVETDPRSSDFGKIKSGNTRWDIWGGFQPYARLTTQILTGQSKSATSGKVYDLDGSKFGGRGVSDQIGTFARGKASPIIGLGWDYLSQRTMDQQTLDRKFGNPFNNPQGQTNLTNELLKSLMPLLINDIIDGAQDRGASAILTVGIPSLFGIGVQTYSPQPVKSKGLNKVPTIQTPKKQVIQHR